MNTFISYTAGIDIGSSFSKSVLVTDSKITSWAIIPSQGNYKEVAETVFQLALSKNNIPSKKIRYIIATGYGANNVSMANETISDIVCHSAGINNLYPSVRTVIDIGGQSTRVFKIDGSGRLINFALNEKCAAGSGKLLQVVARVLNIDISEMGTLSNLSKNKIDFTTSCAVFNESEVISRIAEGARKEDIIDGIHRSLTNKIEALLQRIDHEPDYSLVGGCAKNSGIVKRIEEMLGTKLIIYPEPQIIAALGAALIAQKKL